MASPTLTWHKGFGDPCKHVRAQEREHVEQRISCWTDLASPSADWWSERHTTVRDAPLGKQLSEPAHWNCPDIRVGRVTVNKVIRHHGTSWTDPGPHFLCQQLLEIVVKNR